MSAIIWLLLSDEESSRPFAPTGLLVEAQENPSDLMDITPEFSAIFHDPDKGDVPRYYQIEVSSDVTFSVLFWDSGKSMFGEPTAGSAIPGITYAGSPLSPNITYHWRIRFWDNNGNIGYWSSENSTFSLHPDAREEETPIFREVLQHLTYTYDPVGNITRIEDASETATAGTTVYAYDDFHRLTSAASEIEGQQIFNQMYAYDAVGNIIQKSDQGVYHYGSNGRANPHAVTRVADTTFLYDENGNLVSASDGLENSWTYRNELAITLKNGINVEYSYDQSGRRVSKENGSVKTLYPSALMELTEERLTKYVYADRVLVSTISKSSESGLVNHVHADHLGSTQIISNDIGSITQELGYYPFGDTQVDNQYTQLPQSRQFGGHVKDKETGLINMGARYYASDTGRFISQDPVSLAVGDWKTVQDKTEYKLGFYLQNPQTHNSYSYTANNPLKYVDQNGEYIESAIDIGFIAYDLYKIGEAVVTGGKVKAEVGYLGLDLAGLAAPGGTGFGLAGRIAAKGGDEFVQIQQVAKQNNWGRANTLKDHTAEHGSDFGITDPPKYAKFGNDFKGKIGTEGIEAFTDKSGVTRAYEASSNTFASYNKDGTTKTIFKPSSGNYWNKQKKKHESE